MRSWLTGLAFILAASASSLSAQARDCTDDRGADRCTAAARQTQLGAYGIPAIEAVAASGAELVRAFFVDGYGRDAGLVSFIRGPAAEPRVEWRTPRTDKREPALLSAIVPLSAWEELRADGWHFDRDLVEQAANGPPSICLHAWMVRVEAVDAASKVRSRIDGACGDSLAVRYGFQLAAAAIAAMPSCALLEAGKTRNDVTRLAECGLLAGDRAAAAQAFNAYRTPWFANPRGPDFARALQPLFDERASVTWPGLPSATGGEAASKLWAEHSASSPFYPARLFGESADRVRIEGHILVKGASASDQRTQLPATMVWTRRNGFGFRLQSFDTGPALAN